MTIQADASRYWKLHGRTHIGLLVLVLVVVFLESFRRGLHTTSGALVAVLTLYLAVTGRTWWHLLRGRIQVCVSQLVVQRLLGPSRIIPRGNLALAIYAPHYQLSGTNARARVPRLYLVDRDGQQVLRLRSHLYPGPVMERLLSALTPLPNDHIEEPITSKILDQRHPGMLLFRDLHSAIVNLISLLAPAILVPVILLLLWR